MDKLWEIFVDIASLEEFYDKRGYSLVASSYLNYSLLFVTDIIALLSSGILLNHKLISKNYFGVLNDNYSAFRTPEKIDRDFVQSTHYFGGVCPSSGLLYNCDSPASSNIVNVEEIRGENIINKGRTGGVSGNVHQIFDQSLIENGKNCQLTGVRSVVDVPPSAHYMGVGSLSGLAPVMSAIIAYVMKPFRRLNITTTEFATLQTICFFDPGKILSSS